VVHWLIKAHRINQPSPHTHTHSLRRSVGYASTYHLLCSQKHFQLHNELLDNSNLLCPVVIGQEPFPFWVACSMGLLLQPMFECIAKLSWKRKNGLRPQTIMCWHVQLARHLDQSARPSLPPVGSIDASDDAARETTRFVAI